MFDELSYRYKSLSVAYRLLLCVFISLLPGAYSYFNVIEDLETELNSATAQEVASRRKLADSKEKIKNLPAIEEKLVFTRDQLKKAEQRLPNEVLVDEVIKQIGNSANKTNVQLKSFLPAGFEVIKGEYSYDEVKYEVIMRGKFSDLAMWLDEMSGPESRAYPKAWKMSKTVASRATVPPNTYRVQVADVVESSTFKNLMADIIANKKISSEESAQSERDNFKLDMLVDLSYFRSASAESVAAVDPAKQLDPNSHHDTNTDHSKNTPTNQSTNSPATPQTGGEHAK